MAFDLSTAKPMSSGFDLSTAKPVDFPKESTPVADFAKGAASLADVTVGGILPFAAKQVTYAGGRALGQSPEQAEATSSSVASNFENPFGKAFGITNDAAYKGEAGRKLMDFVGENIGKGAKWLSEKTGLPEADIVNMAGSLMPAAGKGIGMAAKPFAAPVSEAAYAADNALRQRVGMGAEAVRNALAKKPEAQMQGMGAAETALATQRQARAQGLRVPVQLTKGMQTGDPSLVKFEFETARTSPEAEGKPLVEARADRNKAVLRNFEALTEATGSEMAGEGMLPTIGKIVNKELTGAANKEWGKVSKLYDEVWNSPESEMPVGYTPLSNYINEQGPTVRSKLAPLLDAVAEQLKKNDPDGTGVMPLKATEQLRQFINQHYEPGSVQWKYGSEMIKKLDEATADAGGELFKNARAARQRYGDLFEDRGAVAKLLRNKPGTTDRAVAIEDIFDHSILKGTLADTHNIAMVLKRAGEGGQQAWKELQGQLVQHLKEAVTSGMDRDVAGNKLVKPEKLNSMIRALDNDGKLDYIFGKKGAQELRDLRDTLIDMTAKSDAGINYSMSGSKVIKYLEKLQESPLHRVPVAGTVLDYAAKRAKSKQLKKQVEESLNYNALNPNQPVSRNALRP